MAKKKKDKEEKKSSGEEKKTVTVPGQLSDLAKEFFKDLTKAFGEPNIALSEYFAWGAPESSKPETSDGKSTWTGNIGVMTRPELRFTKNHGWQAWIPVAAKLGEVEKAGGKWVDLESVEVKKYVEHSKVAFQNWP